MPDLTKRESAYFIGFAIAAMSLLVATMFLWSQTQKTCWSKYSSEQQAIQECER